MRPDSDEYLSERDILQILQREEDPMSTPFMIPDYEFGNFWEVETPDGTYFLLHYMFTEKEVRENYREVYTVGIRPNMWGARLNAPGYLDCTEWAIFDSKKKAENYIRETFDVDPETGRDLPYL